MAVVGITRQGLTALALSVAALWGFLISERVIMRQATIERAQALRTIESLRDRRSQPVSTPLIRIRRPERPTAG
jgi:hypothetical protein